jgi:acyl-CoA dehydrogenase
VGITVEGANILTRSMIVYGQGAIRCHPYLYQVVTAAGSGDLAAFDRALAGHVWHIVSTAVRATWHGATRGLFAGRPAGSAMAAAYAGFSRMSAAFALVSEAALLTLGATLKRREKISGRLADALAWLYLGSCALKRFQQDGEPPRDLPFVRFACAHATFEIQQALLGVLDNLPARPAAWLIRVLVLPPWSRVRPPDDRLGAAVARGLLEDRETRVALTGDIYVPPPDELGLGRLEAALREAVAAHAVETRIRDAVRAGRLDKAPGDMLLDAALAAGVISAADYEQVRHAHAVRDEVIQVDAFPPEVFAQHRA